MGEELYPPNGKLLSLKSEKLEAGSFRKQNSFSAKIKLGGYSLKDSGLYYLQIPAKPVKYIVPVVYGWNSEKGKFAKQMGQ